MSHQAQAINTDTDTVTNATNLRTQILICGYIRTALQHICPSATQNASELIRIVLSYMKQHHFQSNEMCLTYIWNISAQKLNEILTTNSPQLMSDAFIIGPYTFCVRATQNNQILIFSLACTASQNAFKSILLSSTINCTQVSYADCGLFSFENLMQQKQWLSSGIPLTRRTYQKQLTISIHTRILQILSIRNDISYAHKYAAANNRKSITFEATLPPSLLSTMKGSKFGACFLTDVFQNTFFVRIFPNGIYNNTDSAGKVHISLQWNGEDPALNNKNLNWTVYCKDAHISSAGQDKLSYNKSCIDCKTDTLSFDEFKLYNTFTIFVDVAVSDVGARKRVAVAGNDNNNGGGDRFDVLVSCLNGLDDRLKQLERQRVSDINTMYKQFNAAINSLNLKTNQQIQVINNNLISLQSQISHMNKMNKNHWCSHKPVVQQKAVPMNPQQNEVGMKKKGEQSVVIWLRDKCRLPQYLDAFASNGYENMDMVMSLNDTHLKKIGIQKIGHRKKIIKYIQNYKNELNKNKQASKPAVAVNVNANIKEKNEENVIAQNIVNKRIPVSAPQKVRKLNWGHNKSRNKNINNMNTNNKNDRKKTSVYGDGDTKMRLMGFINKYLANTNGSAIDDILNLNCVDLKVWASIINDIFVNNFRDEFIDLILILFHNNVLNNADDRFRDVVVKYLAIVMDESLIDCPLFNKYVAVLFVNICVNRILSLESLFTYFCKKYKEYSDIDKRRQRKNNYQLIQFAVEEVKFLKAPKKLLSQLNKFANKYGP